MIGTFNKLFEKSLIQYTLYEEGGDRGEMGISLDITDFRLQKYLTIVYLLYTMVNIKSRKILGNTVQK